MKIFKFIKLMWRKRKLEKAGFDFSDVDMNRMMDPSLSEYELGKMESDDIPTDEEVELYFNMYLKKFHLDRENEWSVETPMPFDKFEEKCKTPTEIEKCDSISLIIPGGYRWMISQTVDSFIGIPPVIYHRYVDYEKLVKGGVR